uniref:Uncharacterized protein n=1 Tax=Aegilops tauschii subsp. strangulata TaxID=200361 RepID=A0A453S0H2_AEGTS
APTAPRETQFLGWFHVALPWSAARKMVRSRSCNFGLELQHCKRQFYNNLRHFPHG